MANVNSILTNFTAGELSPRLYGRVDLAKYQNGARELTNLTVLPQGGARKRGGTQFIAAVKNSTARLVEFTFSTEQAYMLEFGEEYIRFFKDRAAIYDVQFSISNIAPAGSTLQVTATGHTFANGDPIIITGVVGADELNNREWRVASATTNKFIIHNIDGSNITLADFSSYVSGGTASRIYEVATQFSAADVAAMTFTQSADTLFLFTGNWPISLLTRASHASWTLTTGNVEEGPFLDMNTDETNTVSIDVASGTGVMTFSQDTLEASHVGALFRIWEKANGSSFGYATWAPGANITVSDGSFWEYKGNVYFVVSGGGNTLANPAANYPTHTKGTADVYYGNAGATAQMRYEHSGYCVVQVQSIVDTKNAWVTVVKNRVPYTAYAARSSFQWQEGAWSDRRGYPTVGTFHEQRLVAGGTEHQPTTVWGSNINAYLLFKDGDKDDETYVYTISSDRVDAIKFITSTKRLVINATSGEYIAAASNANEAITPTNIKVSPETSFGVAKVRTVRAGPAVLFAQRAGLNTNPARRLREFVYNFQTDSYTAPDMTILAEHITKPGLVSGAFSASPDPMVWYCRSDGILVAMTYERDQQVVGWHRHPLGGDGMAKNVAVIPGSDGDELWLIVERTIDGNTVRYIEVMTVGLADGGDLEDAFYLDCALSYSGSPISNINGLFHLEGEEVDIFADGVPIRDKTITRGRLTLDNAASKIVIGYRILSRLRTLRIEAGAQGGTAQGQIGRVHEIIVRLQASIGGNFGQDPAIRALDPIPYRDASQPMSTPIPLYTGDIVLPFDGDWDRERGVTIEHDDPLPFTLTALIIGQSVAG